jgi:hypothetical protein
MAITPAFFRQNRESTQRMRDLLARLDDDGLRHTVGKDWTVAAALAHLAFWDRRAIVIIEQAQREGDVAYAELNGLINDILLPFLLAIPPRDAARIAVETAEEIDALLERCPPDLQEKLYAANERFIRRSLHRMLHLDEIDAELNAKEGK